MTSHTTRRDAVMIIKPKLNLKSKITKSISNIHKTRMRTVMKCVRHSKLCNFLKITRSDVLDLTKDESMSRLNYADAVAAAWEENRK